LHVGLNTNREFGRAYQGIWEGIPGNFLGGSNPY
jgi:hypothetical protein